MQPQEGGGGGRGCGSFLSLRHSVALSMQAEGGREGGGEGAGREDGGRREGMLAGPLRRDVPAAGGAPPAAPNLQGRCTTARHPQHMHSAMPTAGGSAAEPHGLGCWGLMSRVRDAQGHSQGTGHPVTPTFLRLPSCANLP